jgi:hypothetical protein
MNILWKGRGLGCPLDLFFLMASVDKFRQVHSILFIIFSMAYVGIYIEV